MNEHLAAMQGAIPGTIVMSFSCQGDGTPPAAESGELFTVRSVEVREAISTPYEAVVVVDSPDGELDLVAFADASATLTLSKARELSEVADRKITGIVVDFAFVEPVPGRSMFRYRAVVRPEIVKLDRSRQNQIYGADEDLSVVDVAVREVTGSGAKGHTAETSPNLLPFRIDVGNLVESYPNRDYIVQYAESDLDFVSRLLEHWGIFYYFTPGHHGEVMVLADTNTPCPSIAPEEIPFAPPSGLYGTGRDSILRLSATARPLPAKVFVRDYNDDTPHVTIEGEAEVDPNGHGIVSLYGENVRTSAEADQIARIRAEEIAATGLEFRGESDCPHMAAGHVFKLSDHPRDDFNREYLVVSVEHVTRSATEERGPREPDGRTDVARIEYVNRFVAIPLSTAYRPPRRTEKPKVAGLMHARVDAAGDGARAEVDDQGRYRIRMPFDVSGREDGKASRKVRMAQPYAGTNSGMHFPLLKGTDVTVACYGGDPDRPLITGAVPNPLRQSPVDTTTRTHNTVRTTSGMTIDMDDSQDGSASVMTLRVPGGSGESFIKMGPGVPSGGGAAGGGSGEAAGGANGGGAPAGEPRHLSGSTSGTADPAGNGSNGHAAPPREARHLSGGSGGGSSGGDNNTWQWTKGSYTMDVGKDFYFTTIGYTNKNYIGAVTKQYVGGVSKSYVGIVNSNYAAAVVKFMVGLETKLLVGGALKVAVGPSKSLYTSKISVGASKKSAVATSVSATLNSKSITATKFSATVKNTSVTGTKMSATGTSMSATGTSISQTGTKIDKVGYSKGSIGFDQKVVGFKAEKKGADVSKQVFGDEKFVIEKHASAVAKNGTVADFKKKAADFSNRAAHINNTFSINN